jgi:hypothetical protein
MESWGKGIHLGSLDSTYSCSLTGTSPRCGQDAEPRWRKGWRGDRFLRLLIAGLIGSGGGWSKVKVLGSGVCIWELTNRCLGIAIPGLGWWRDLRRTLIAGTDLRPRDMILEQFSGGSLIFRDRWLSRGRKISLNWRRIRPVPYSPRPCGGDVSFDIRSMPN